MLRSPLIPLSQIRLNPARNASFDTINSILRKVALFVTCIVDTVFPDVGEATLTLLERHGVNPAFPEAQTCCGQPAFNSGFTAQSRDVAEQFVRTFQAYDHIVTPSGSCAAMIRHYYPQLFKDHALAAAAERVAHSTYELSEYLADVLGVTDIGTVLKTPTRATLHDACHGLRGLGIASNRARCSARSRT